MKRLFVILILLLPLNGPAQQPMFQSENFPTGLLARWNLCGDTSATSGCAASSSTTVYDSSENGIIGTWSGTAAGSTGYYSAGHTGPWAGYFNGTNNAIAFGNMGLNFSNPWSACAWVNLRSLGTTPQVILQVGTATSGESVQLLVNSTNGFYLDTWGPVSTLISHSVPSTSTWYDVCFVINSTSTASIYVNGTAVVTAGAFSTSSVAGYSGNFIGNYGAVSGSNTLIGSINFVSIYNRALSAGEIAAMALSHN